MFATCQRIHVTLVLPTCQKDIYNLYFQPAHTKQKTPLPTTNKPGNSHSDLPINTNRTNKRAQLFAERTGRWCSATSWDQWSTGLSLKQAGRSCSPTLWNQRTTVSDGEPSIPTLEFRIWPVNKHMRINKKKTTLKSEETYILTKGKLSLGKSIRRKIDAVSSRISVCGNLNSNNYSSLFMSSGLARIWVVWFVSLLGTNNVGTTHMPWCTRGAPLRRCGSSGNPNLYKPQPDEKKILSPVLTRQWTVSPCNWDDNTHFFLSYISPIRFGQFIVTNWAPFTCFQHNDFFSLYSQ